MWLLTTSALKGLRSMRSFLLSMPTDQPRYCLMEPPVRPTTRPRRQAGQVWQAIRFEVGTFSSLVKVRTVSLQQPSDSLEMLRLTKRFYTGRKVPAVSDVSHKSPQPTNCPVQPAPITLGHRPASTEDELCADGLSDPTSAHRRAMGQPSP